MKDNRQLKETEEKIRNMCTLRNVDRIFVLTDDNVAPMVEEFLKDSPRLAVRSGEGSKSIEGAQEVWLFLEREGALRRSAVVNLGGGMVSDLGGFAAATFKRGIGCINAPTTLLAAVDAAIGGKTGINFAGLKNEVGVFSMPWGVFPLTSLFGSLSEDEWLSGAGEAIKTGLLDSEELFRLATSEEFLVERNPAVVDEVVRRCAEFKGKVVKEDFKESGRRKILNLGHTAGHAIEAWKMAAGQSMPHGVAVAHGIRFALERSCRQVGLPEEVLSRYEEVLEKFFPPLDMSDKDWEEASAYMAHDKKNVTAGNTAWVLLSDIGNPLF